MLRLFRNAGVRPALRCIVPPRSSLPALQLTLRKQYSSLPAQPPHFNQSIGKDEPRLSLTFTCTAPECSTRSSHTFTKRAYENGVVLVQCPGCKNRHLIADHLGWFKDSTEDGKLRTVEDLLRARGEKVRRGRVNGDAGEGDIELYE